MSDSKVTPPAVNALFLQLVGKQFYHSFMTKITRKIIAPGDEEKAEAFLTMDNAWYNMTNDPNFPPEVMNPMVDIIKNNYCLTIDKYNALSSDGCRSKEVHKYLCRLIHASNPDAPYLGSNEDSDFDNLSDGSSVIESDQKIIDAALVYDSWIQAAGHKLLCQSELEKDDIKALATTMYRVDQKVDSTQVYAWLRARDMGDKTAHPVDLENVEVYTKINDSYNLYDKTHDMLAKSWDNFVMEKFYQAYLVFLRKAKGCHSAVRSQLGAVHTAHDLARLCDALASFNRHEKACSTVQLHIRRNAQEGKWGTCVCSDSEVELFVPAANGMRSALHSKSSGFSARVCGEGVSLLTLRKKRTDFDHHNDLREATFKKMPSSRTTAKATEDLVRMFAPMTFSTPWGFDDTCPTWNLAKALMNRAVKETSGNAGLRNKDGAANVFVDDDNSIVWEPSIVRVVYTMLNPYLEHCGAAAFQHNEDDQNEEFFGKFFQRMGDEYAKPDSPMWSKMMSLLRIKKLPKFHSWGGHPDGSWRDAFWEMLKPRAEDITLLDDFMEYHRFQKVSSYLNLARTFIASAESRGISITTGCAETLFATDHDRMTGPELMSLMKHLRQAQCTNSNSSAHCGMTEEKVIQYYADLLVNQFLTCRCGEEEKKKVTEFVKKQVRDSDSALHPLRSALQHNEGGARGGGAPEQGEDSDDDDGGAPYDSI